MNKPLRRIVAILRLAAATSSVHEAAAARATAERLQEMHKISDQEIAPFLEATAPVSFQAAVHDLWRETLLQALARHHGCAYTWHASTVTIAGAGAATVRDQYLYTAAAIDLRKARGQETVHYHINNASYTSDFDFFNDFQPRVLHKSPIRDRLKRIYRRQFEIEATSQIVESIEALTRRIPPSVAHPLSYSPTPSQTSSPADTVIQESSRDEQGIPRRVIDTIKASAAMGAHPFGKQIFHKIMTWKVKTRYLMECKTCAVQVAAARAEAAKLQADLVSRSDQTAAIKRLQSEAETDRATITRLQSEAETDRATITRLRLELDRAKKDNEAMQIAMEGRTRTTTEHLLEID